MSYGYFSAKKFRKRTKMQRLENQIETMQNTIKTLTGLMLFMSEGLGTFANTANWLEKTVHNSGCPETKEGCYCNPRSGYEWNGEGNPLQTAKESLDKISTLVKQFRDTVAHPGPKAEQSGEHHKEGASNASPAQIEAVTPS